MISPETRKLLLRSTSLLVAVSSFMGTLQGVSLRGLDVSTVIGGLAALLPLAALYLGETGRARAGGIVLVVTVFTLLTAITAYYGNRYVGTSTLYLLSAMLAGFLISPRAAVVVSALGVCVLFALTGAELAGAVVARDATPWMRLTTNVATLVATTALFVVALRALRQSFDVAAKRAAELEQVRAGLEREVEVRTRGLVEARDNALAADRAKGAFLGNISHELRTPLHALLAMAAELDLSDLKPAQRDLVAVLRRSGDALLQIVQDLIDQARIEAGRLPIESVSWSPRDATFEIAALMQGQADARGLLLSVRIDPQVPDRVTGDPARVRQVLLNLVGNALKFTAQGSVEVHVSRPDDQHLCLRVTDTGIGIAANDQRLLFAPFSQIDSSATRRHGGTGLGLSISRQLVELMGGTIELESAPGHGSTFRFTVHAPSATRADAPLEPMLEVSGLRVLVVEDNAVNRRVAELMLARLHCSVSGVEGGQAALDAMQRETFDVVLLDIQMPDLDGLEVTRRLRARPGAQPRVVVMTASAQPNDAEAARSAGADVFLAKPASLEQLARALHQAKGIASSLGGVDSPASAATGQSSARTERPSQT